jgi:hypothetical protein
MFPLKKSLFTLKALIILFIYDLIKLNSFLKHLELFS